MEIQPGGSGYLTQTKGDALELEATFSLAENAKATRFGLRLRQLGSFSCDVAVTREKGGRWTYGIGPTSGWNGSLVPQPTAGTVTLRVFLDRSIVEVYTGGSALTERCMLPAAITERLRASGTRPSEAAAVDAFAEGGGALLIGLESWGMRSMWGDARGSHQ